MENFVKFTPEDILEEWKKDSPIDDTALGKELVKTSHLHSKYLELLMKAKSKLSQTEAKYNKMKNLRKSYYRGEMTLSQLQEYGWDQYQGLKQSHSEFMNTTEIDPILCDEKIKVDFYKSLVIGLEYIMKQIHQRDYSIKSLIEYNKLIMGG
jgi:hypothetical protein